MINFIGSDFGNEIADVGTKSKVETGNPISGFPIDQAVPINPESLIAIGKKLAVQVESILTMDASNQSAFRHAMHNLKGIIYKGQKHMSSRLRPRLKLPSSWQAEKSSFHPTEDTPSRASGTLP